MTYSSRYISPTSLLAVLLITMSSLLVACSADDAQERGSALRLVSFTRSGSPFTVTTDYSPICLYLYSPETDLQSGNYSYLTTQERWKSSVEVKAGREYAVYGYSPVNAASAAALRGTSLTGTTITLSGVSAVTASDVCVVIGVQQLESESDTKNIVMGRFGFTGKGQDENFVNLLMDHLLSAIRFSATLDSDYAKLRSIKLKKMELQTNKSTVDITVSLASNEAGSNPITSVSYDNLTGTARRAVFFDSETGVELTATEPQEATCCLAPGVSGDLSLTTTYEVYDRHGKFIGERTATNKLPSMNIARGQRVQFNLQVSPTYLYVLSEPDLDNPTINIE